MKKASRFLALLMAGAMVFAAAAPARAEVTGSDAAPLITEDVFPTLEYVGQKNSITGFYTAAIQVGEDEAAVERAVKFYIPEDSHWALYYVLINTPEGENPDTFLEESGWKAAADKEQFGIVLLEGVDGAYASDEEEAEYIKAAYSFLSGAKYFKLNTNAYVVGYGHEGTLLEQYVASNPLPIAAAAFVNADDVDPEAMAAIGAENADTRTKVTKAEVPTPVLIYADDLATKENALAYWKAANYATEAEAEEGTFGETVYRGADDTQYTYYTNTLQVATVEGPVDVKDPSIAENIYSNFLKKVFSYGSVATGWVTGERADYAELGVEFKTFDQDGVTREYMVYIPADLDTTNPVPAVFVAPGAGSTDTFMFDTSMWWKQAQMHGFIVVELTGAINPGDGTKLGGVSWDSHSETDLEYIKEAVAQVVAEYNADPGRCYFTGQSQGSIMSHFVSMNIPEVFAAIGSTSAGINPGMVDETDSTVKIPYKLVAGEWDVMSWDFTTGNDFQTWNTVRHYTELNQPTKTTFTYGGRYVNYIWETDDDIPVFVFTECHGRGHSVVCSDVEEIWEFLSHYSQDENDVTYYSASAFAEDDAVVLFGE